MRNLISNDLLKKHHIHFIFLAVLIWVAGYSLATLTTRPGIWIDEAKSIELARNWLDFGTLDIQVAPGEFSDFPQLLHSTGYPVLLTLAGFFKIFGYGFPQARVFMLLWMILALAAIFLFLKEMMGEREAVFAVILMSTFASFYDSGRTVVGEIPGFLLLIAGLYFWIKKDLYYWAGLFAGVAVVTKPSVFGLIVPAGLLVILLEKKNIPSRLYKLAVGMVPAALAWIFFVLNDPFSKTSWLSIGNFYKNPYSSSIADNVIRNLQNIPYSTTLIYFGLLLVIVAGARYFYAKRPVPDKKIVALYHFVIIYSALAFFYYLRSPGWLRYILIGELLILAILPHAVGVVFDAVGARLQWPQIKRDLLAAGFLIMIAVVQVVQLFTAAEIFYSDAAIKAAEYINKNFPGSSVAAINVLPVSVLLDTDKRFNVVEMTGMPVVGRNPLLGEVLPDIAVAHTDSKFIFEARAIIDTRYDLVADVGGYNIYKRR